MSKSKKVFLISFGALVAFCFLLLGIVFCAVGIYKVETDSANAASDDITNFITQACPSPVTDGVRYQISSNVSRIDSSLSLNILNSGYSSYNVVNRTGYCFYPQNYFTLYSNHEYLFYLAGHIEGGSSYGNLLWSYSYNNNISIFSRTFQINSSLTTYLFRFSPVEDIRSSTCLTFFPQYFASGARLYIEDFSVLDLYDLDYTFANDGDIFNYFDFGNMPFLDHFPISLNMFRRDGIIWADNRVNEESASYLQGVSDGEVSGYQQALSVLGSSYTTNVDDFQSGYNVYTLQVGGNYSFGRGALTANRLSVGWSDMFPSLTFSQLQSLGLSCSFFADLGYVTSSADSTLSQYITPNSYQKILTSAYFSSYSTLFSYIDNLGDCIEITFKLPSAYPQTDYLLTLGVYETYTTVNYTPVNSHSSVDDLYTVYVLDFNPTVNQSYEYNFLISSSEAQSIYDLGVSAANKTLNTSSVSYTTGYNRGFADAENPITFTNLMTSVLDVPLKTFNSLFNFDFLGINLKAFLLSLFTLGLIVAIIRLCLGGKS